MKALAILIITLFVWNSNFAQTILTGYVTQQNSGKKPVADVEIKSLGANTVRSTTSGEFVLQYPNFTAGTPVVLNPSKPNWEIVNKRELSLPLPNSAQGTKVKIVMALQADIDKAKAEYYQISEKYLAQAYEKKMASLNKQVEGWQQEAARISEELNRTQERLIQIAEEYSFVNLDDATEIEKQAIQLFKEGKIDEAIRLRESLNSEKELKKGINLKQKADSMIAVHTKNLLDLAQYYELSFNFDSAEAKRETIALADTNNFENQFQFAYFLSKLNEHDRAIQYYRRALRKAKLEPEVASTLLCLGISYKQNYLYPEAEHAYNRALAVYNSLAESNPAIYEQDIANTLNSIGNLYSDDNKYILAEQKYKSALEIYMRLSKTNPFIYDPDMAILFIDLGALYDSMNNYSEAEYMYRRALEIYERLGKTNLSVDISDYAMIYNNLGVLNYEKVDYHEAEIAFNHALEIRERLARTNPYFYEPELAITLFNMGNLFQAMNDFPKAQNVYNRAVEILERLANNNPSSSEPHLADALNNLGNVYLEIKNYLKAESAFNRALEIRLRIAKTKKLACFERDAAITFNNLGRLFQDQNKYIEAKQAYECSLEIFDRLAKANITCFERDRELPVQNLSIMYGNKAWYLILNKQFSEAEQSARQALSLKGYTKPEGHDSEVEWVNTNLALALLLQGKYADAEAIYLKFKDKPYKDKTYKETFLADLEEVEKAGITHPDIIRIREILNN